MAGFCENDPLPRRARSAGEKQFLLPSWGDFCRPIACKRCCGKFPAAIVQKIASVSAIFYNFFKCAKVSGDFRVSRGKILICEPFLFSIAIKSVYFLTNLIWTSNEKKLRSILKFEFHKFIFTIRSVIDNYGKAIMQSRPKTQVWFFKLCYVIWLKYHDVSTTGKYQEI